jgi:ribosome-associated protein
VRDAARVRTLDAREYALSAAEAAAEKKAMDVAVIDVGDLLVVTDYFVVCTGETDRQVVAIAEEVERQLKERGLAPIGREGLEEGRWVLLDFADVVVHVFQPEQRDFYRLERLWDDAPRVEVSPEVTNATYIDAGGRGRGSDQEEASTAGTL